MDKKEPDKEWHPILVGAEAREVLGIVENIAKTLHRPPPAWVPLERDGVEPYRVARGASLAVGASGIALFFAYLSHTFGDDPPFADEADRFVSHACDVLETAPMSGSLYRGLSGVAWTVQHLQGLLYDEEPYDPEADPNGEIDRILLDHWSKPEKFDLWEGCIGLGIYALERYPITGSKVLLELLIDRMEQLAVRNRQGITWFTPPGTLRSTTRLAYPEGFYDLGVAHGTAGAVSFLSRVYARGILKDVSGKLLEGAVSWLLAQQQESESGPFFPEFLFPSGKTESVTGGWCHGDIGMAAALLSAARCAGEPAWEAHAVKIAHAVIERLDRQASPGATLCHGSAGLAHLFNRLYQATGEQRFREEARRWFTHTVKIRKPGSGVAGFSRYGMNEDGDFEELYDPGFIQGAAGIGLAFLAAAAGIEPRWDRVMLISAPEYY